MQRSLINIGLVLGALAIAAVPVIAMRLAVDHHARSGARIALEHHAERMLQHAEGVLAEAFDALAALSGRASLDCSPDTRAALSSVVAEATQLRHIAILDDSGRSVCASSEVPSENDVVVHARPTRVGETTLSLVRRRGEGRYSLVLTRPLGEGALSAMLAPNAHTIDNLPVDWRGNAIATLAFDDGTPIARPSERGPITEPGAAGGLLVAHRASDALPLRVDVALPDTVALAPYRALGLFVDVGGIIVGLAFTVLAWNLSRRQRSIEDALARALRLDEFVPYYQPVFDLRTGAIVGCEALIRWQKRDGTLVPPGVFIQQAEESGLAIPMTRRLMEKCRDELGAVYATRPHLKVAINLFADHFEDLSTVEDVRRIFARGGVAFTQVVFEVTERYPLANLTRARVAINALQDLGCRVALDDAGTGHGGLTYLQKLGLDQVKIDKVFVDTITGTTASSPIIDSLTELARSMRMEIVAEGVETLDQVEYLRRRGIHMAQGYLFSKPLPGPLYLHLIRAMDPPEKPIDHAPEDPEALSKAA